MPDRLYLDHAATTPMLAEAAEAATSALGVWANASSPHAEGRAARAMLERARAGVAAAYGWGGEVIFTSGASEAIALAIGRGVHARIVTSAVEHDAVRRVAGDAAVIGVDAAGAIDLDALDAVLAAGPALVAVQWGNGETGVVQPLDRIAAIVAARGATLFVDAAQMPAVSHAALAGADLVAVSAHKRGGPPGVGALLVRDLALLHAGGGQERGYRGGTENVPGAVGHAAALAVAEPVARWADLRARLDEAIRVGGGIVVADAGERAAHVGSYRMPGVAAAVQLIRFDLGGIAVSAGAACSSGSLRPSPVLSAMGWDAAAAGEVVRVSFGRATGEADVDRFVAAWRGIAG